MNTLTRTGAALLIGGSLLLGGSVACATPHTIDGYISEIRGSMDDYESRNTADSQIVSIGQGMCSYPESLNTDFMAESDMTPQQQEDFKLLADTTRDYCDVLGTAPAVGDPGGMGGYGGDTVNPAAAVPAAPVVVPPTPVEVGKPIAINYGGEDVVTTTINSVSRCGQSLVLDLTMKTGDTYSTTDGVATSMDFVGEDGITQTVSQAYDYQCTASGELPYSMDRKPGRTYQGKFLVDVPAGQGGTLNLYGSDGITRTLAISAK